MTSEPTTTVSPEVVRAADRPNIVTVVVPTFNEQPSVGPLLERVAATVGHLPVEVLFVDDSTDRTPDAVRELGCTAGVPVRLLHRPPDRRTGGLGGAVLAGLRSTDSEWAVVMDGDLQHPPEVLLPLVDRAVATGADVVVASRYVDGGSADGLADARRRWVSSVAGLLATVAFPRRLHGCTDPMSGFFLVHRGAIDLDRLAPDGFKILLEVLCRGGRLRICEVPFVFGRRHAGESKAGLRQGLVYLRHLLRLRFAGPAGRLAGFLAVGATGVLPNLLTVTLLTLLGTGYLLSTAVGTLVGASSNFLITDLLLFRGSRTGRMRHRCLGYVGMAVADIAIRVPLVAVMVGRWHVHLLVATVLSIVAAGAARFVVLDRAFYRGVARPAVPPGAHERPAYRARRRLPARPAAPHVVLLAEAVRGAR